MTPDEQAQVRRARETLEYFSRLHGSHADQLWRQYERSVPQVKINQEVLRMVAAAASGSAPGLPGGTDYASTMAEHWNRAWTPLRSQRFATGRDVADMVAWPSFYERALAASQVQSWSRQLTYGLVQIAETVRRSLMPPNVAPIRDVSFADLTAIARDESIALHLVPSTEVVRALLDAPDAAARRVVLDERREQILSDCDTVLDLCVDESTYGFVPFVREAVAAARAGFHAAAQALAANTLDSIMGTAMAHRKASVTRHARGAPPPVELVDSALVDGLVFLPVWAAYEQFRTTAGDEVPTTFHRHAAAHAVGAAQFTSTNAVQGLMIVVSLVGYINDL